MARPLKKVDESLIFQLASEGKTYEQIGKEVGLNADSLAKRYKEHIKKGRDDSKDSFLNKCLRQAFPPEGMREKANVGFAVLYAKLMGWYVERSEVKTDVPQQTMSDKEIRDYAEFILWQKQKEQAQSVQVQTGTIST